MSYNIHDLSRRERQIMDALFELESASAQDIREAIPDAPSYSAVRALIANLVKKEHVTYVQQGTKHIYKAAHDMDSARTGAVKRLVNTFFSGSVVDAVTGLLGSNTPELSTQDLDRLEKMIDTARKNADIKNDSDK